MPNIPNANLPNLKIKVQITVHFHSGSQCTAHHHNSSCGGMGTLISCEPVSYKPPDQKPFTWYACTHVARVLKLAR